MNYKKADNLNDQSLVENVLGGDTNAFKVIIKNTEGLVAQIIFKMISNTEDRKDIAQDIYLKAFQKLERFRFQSKLSTWIGQITYNTCLNYLEKKKLFLHNDKHNEDNESYYEELETLNNKVDLFSNETEKIFFKKEVSEILKVEMEKLSPVQKTLITLYHNEELSYSEITEITGLPEGTVKNYLFRARKLLRENLLRSYKKEAL